MTRFLLLLIVIASANSHAGATANGSPSCVTTIITFFPPVSLTTCTGSIAGLKQAGWQFDFFRSANTLNTPLEQTSILIRDSFMGVQLECAIPQISALTNFADPLLDFRGWFSVTKRSTSFDCENLRLVNGSMYRTFADYPLNTGVRDCTTSGPYTTCFGEMGAVRSFLPSNGFAEFEQRFDKSGASYTTNYKFRMQSTSGLFECEAAAAHRKSWAALLNADTGFSVSMTGGVCYSYEYRAVTSAYSSAAF